MPILVAVDSFGDKGPISVNYEETDFGSIIKKNLQVQIVLNFCWEYAMGCVVVNLWNVLWD